jgi:hypothetical protein
MIGLSLVDYFYPLYAFFALLGEKRHTKKVKYHAAAGSRRLERKPSISIALEPRAEFI